MANAAPALDGFRLDFYQCLTARADALFELVDGLCSPVHVDSLAHVTLAASVLRGHGAAYAALSKGNIDADRMRDVLAAQRPKTWRPDFAIDSTTWPRCEADCSAGRGHYYHPSRHLKGKPIVAGWSYQWLAALNDVRDSWTAPLDVCRLKPGEHGKTVAVKQIEQLLSRLGQLTAEPLFVFDAGYDLVYLTHELRGENTQIAVRIRNDRRFYTRAPRTSLGHDLIRKGTNGGRPPLHGKAMRCADPASWPTPDSSYLGAHLRYGQIHAQSWARLHPRQSRYHNHDGTIRIIEGTVIRIQVENIPGSPKKHHVIWLWWAGPCGSVPDLHRIVHAYLRRYDMEHTFRFAKQVLGWTTPKLRTPDQADRWTWLTVAALTQLRLARDHVADHRLPWQPPLPAHKMTPGRVRAGFGHLLRTIVTPASRPKPSRPGPGRPKGRRSKPAPRFPVEKVIGLNSHLAAQRR